MIKIKNAYDRPLAQDGCRILVDIWPRGLNKHKAKINLWVKELTPYPALQLLLKWSPKNNAKWESFKTNYKKSLVKRSKKLKMLKQVEKKARVITLLHSNRNERFNQARVIKEILNKMKLPNNNKNVLHKRTLFNSYRKAMKLRKSSFPILRGSGIKIWTI